MVERLSSTTRITGGRIMKIDQVAHAVGEVLVVRRSVSSPGAGPVASRKTNRLTVPLTAIFAVVALKLARLGRDRLAHLADELGRTFVEHTTAASIGASA